MRPRTGEPSPPDPVGRHTAVDLEVDARGLRCPLPVVHLAAATRDLPTGRTVRVLWTDPAARHDVPAWARMRGHDVVRTEQDDDGGATTIRLGHA